MALGTVAVNISLLAAAGARTSQGDLPGSRDGRGLADGWQGIQSKMMRGLVVAHHVRTADGPGHWPGWACSAGQQPTVVEPLEDDLLGRGAVAGLLGQGPGERKDGEWGRGSERGGRRERGSQ